MEDRFNYADSHATVQISAKRFELSPFHELYATDEMVFGIYARRFYALTLGEDPVEHYWHLRRQAVLYDVPERPVEIRGPDALALLERVASRPIASLRTNRARYAIACAPDGGIVMDGVVMKFADDHYWFVQADGEFENWLRANSDGLDVMVTDPKSNVLQIQGPASLEILKSLSGGVLNDSNFGYFHTAKINLAGQSLRVSRTGWTGELGFEIYALRDTTDCKALWQAILEHGKAHGLAVSSLESMGIRRIEAGILDNGTDMDQSMTPFQAGLGAFVDLDKPHFVGRSSLIEADQGQRLFGLTCAEQVPFAGFAVHVNGEPAGQMTAGAWSPFLNKGIGYVRFDSTGDRVGQTVTLVTRDETEHDATVVALPFYDAAKKIPRGLDRTAP